MHVLSFLIQLSLYALTSVLLRHLLQYVKPLESITPVECALRPKYLLIESACDAILKPLGFTVPKLWFTHFYVLGLSLSAASSAMLYLCHSGKVTFPVRSNMAARQGRMRRLCECILVEKMSQTARMRGGHYIVGHLFQSILAGDAGGSVPKIVVIMYLLSRLKKYSLTPPKHLDCPHYTAEVVIYLAVAWILWTAVSLGTQRNKVANFMSKIRENGI
ncbi:hypothetical protein V1505DRAFT_416473 [Lipomyces doorenjongii]